MPASTTRTTCTDCGHSRGMSIFNELCNECFDTRYLLCEDCGALLRDRSRNSSAHRTNRYHLGGQVYRVDGIIYCSTCYNYHRNVQLDWWRPKPLDVSFATYQRIGSKRKFGVEIETASCAGRQGLYGRTKFGCKDDPTVDGAEFDSPILYGDEGLAHISRFLEFASEHDWRVDRRCGCHTHYDMRDEPDKQLYRIAYAYKLTWRMWERCVPQQRRDGSYCHPPEYTTRDIVAAFSANEDFSSFCCHHDRYNYVNLYAYDVHKTFENRLLEGTLDAEVICNWITVNCRFADCVKGLTFRELRVMFGDGGRSSFRALVNLIDNAALTDWVADRARYVGRRPLRGPRTVSSSPPRRRQQPTTLRQRVTDAGARGVGVYSAGPSHQPREYVV